MGALQDKGEFFSLPENNFELILIATTTILFLLILEQFHQEIVLICWNNLKIIIIKKNLNSINENKFNF